MVMNESVISVNPLLQRKYTATYFILLTQRSRILTDKSNNIFELSFDGIIK